MFPAMADAERTRQGSLVQQIMVVFSTGLYTGYSPVAPGSVGTMLAVPLYLALSRLSPVSYGITILAFLLMACWMAGAAEHVFNTRDSRRIVIDEVAGFLVTMTFLPPTTRHMLLGFALFRLFDIVKPFPIRRLENLKGGYGVVADDVMAGIYGNMAVRVCIFLWQG